MRVFILIAVFLFHFTSPVKSQTVSFGPKSILLDQLDVQDPDDAVVAGDFDNDGDIDLAGVSSGNLLWFQNKGDFTFDTIDLPQAPFEKVRDVADMNADGIDDLITSHAFFALDSMQNFTRHVLNLGGFRLVRFARDLNLDGYADIVAENNEPGENPIMYRYQNDGGTGFTEKVLDGQETSYDYATAADYNLDGRMDIIISNSDKNRFLVYRQDANGNFPRVVIGVTTEILDKGLGIANMDSDTDLDIISGAPLDFQESLYFIENKSLAFTIRHPIVPFLNIYSLETGDLDGDGDEDLVFIERTSSYGIGYIINEGNDNWSDPVHLGSFSGFGTFAYQNINLFDTWLHLKDMDQDGKKDIVVSAIPDDEVFWFKNETIFTATETPVNMPALFYPQPAVDFVHVDNLPIDASVLTFFDNYGRQVMRTNIKNHDLVNVASLSMGLNYYVISNQEHQPLLSGKLLKVAR